LCFIFAGVYGSAVADEYDILVNDDGGSRDQTNPRIAVGTGGQFIVVWADKRNNQNDIYFQLFDSAGTALSVNRKINDDDATAPRFEPSVDANYNSNFISAWRDFRNGSYPFNPDVYFSIIDTSETAENFNLTSALSDITMEAPDVAMFADGSSVIVWPDYRNGNWDIFARRINAIGEAVGGDIVVNSDVGTNQQHGARVDAFADGGFVVVWYDNRTGNDDIYFQRFNSSGAAVGSNIKVNDDTDGARQAFPVAAADGNNQFYIAWVDWRNGDYPANPDIYMRRYDSSGTAISSSVKVNGGVSGRPQREVSICADRMGNIGIAWSDSSEGDWNAMARIVDYQGYFTGVPFKIHDETVNRQIQPDIATNGYKFFCTWADYRDNNFDIYASIIEYNDPTLIPDRDVINFTMEDGGALPSAEDISLSNAGLGELNWRAVPTVEWLTVSPDSGQTPETFSISVNTDTLSYGKYYGTVKLIDLDNDDSTEVISVSLNVTAPLVSVTPDTLHFKVLAELGNPDPRSFRVQNSGTGFLNWTASESSDWFEIDMTSGSQDDYIEVSVDISGLMYGNYYGELVVNSVEAVNSPDTGWVYLELVGNMPYIQARPDSLSFYTSVDESVEDIIEIVNPGAGSLSWNAIAGDDWVSLDKTTGTDYDTIGVSINTSGLESGYHQSSIIIYDSASFNLEITIPVSLYLSSNDTLQFLNASAAPGGMGMMPLILNLNQSSSGGYIPFDYDTLLAELDSIVWNDGVFPDYVGLFSGIGLDGRAEIGFRVDDSLFGDSTISSGEYNIANLFFTAADTNAHCYIDSCSSDTAGLYILDAALDKTVPYLVIGDLVIGSPTPVDDPGRQVFPDEIYLGQNYPNPFNIETVIELSMPRSGEVTLAVYNILGQKVCEIFDGHLMRGDYRFGWDSVMDDGRPAPSGIYFYRLSTENYSSVKKMALIK